MDLRNTADMFFEIVRDDRQGDEAWLRAAFRLVGPRTNKICDSLVDRAQVDE